MNKIDKKIVIILLGNKRNNNSIHYSFSYYHELNYMIEDFIYNKKIISIEEYKIYFEKIKIMIEYNKVNNNLINLLLKLLRLNSSRNFNEKIILKYYYIDLQKEIKNKIISNLFDSSNLFLEEENI